MSFSVQMDEEYYRIVGPDGEEGDIVPYGARATLDLADGSIYTCLIVEAPDAPVDDSDEEANNEYRKQCRELCKIFVVEELTEVAGVKHEDAIFPPEVTEAAKAFDEVMGRFAPEKAVDIKAEKVN